MQKKTLFLILIFIFIFVQLNAQNKTLSQKISLTANNITTKEALKKIEKTANVKFSYNSELINTEKIVSVRANNIKLEDCLEQIFQNSINYQVAGNHIILLKGTKKKQAQKNTEKQIFNISGTIKDFNTGERLENVSVYDVNDKYFCLTNKQGFYKLTITESANFRGLNYGKRGYFDTVLVINANKKSIYNINLLPKPKIDTSSLNSKEFFVSKPIAEKRIIPSALISKKSVIHAQNLEHISINKFAQISFLPKLGTNFLADGLTYNNLSFNVLAGYSKGIKGAEFASLINIIKENVNGVQFAGIANIVGNKVNGYQAAGISNVNIGTLKGVQFAGITNVSVDTVYGAQFSGLSNIARTNLNGIQFSGFSNITVENMNGLQIGGFHNLNLKNTNGVQIAGINNFGLKNINGIQFAGFVNNGMQEVRGIQIAGFANYAQHLKGLQIAPFNFSDTSSGISIGLFNYVRNGYRTFEVSSNEIFFANFTFKSGTRHFYNIYNFGARPAKQLVWGYGFGFGTSIRIFKWLYFNIEDVFNNLSINEFYNKKPYFYNSTLISFQIQFAKHFSINTGLSFNIHAAKNTDNKYFEYISDLPHFYFYEIDIDNIQTQYWAGFTIGLSF